MTETQKPFACAREGCEMAFTNEDHLNVHKKKHEMALHLGIDTQSNSVADQTPTPTRFIRNCEEVGLFQDLQNVNPFDETFRKATELAKTGSVHIPDAGTALDDSLHTPHIFPHIEEESSTTKFNRHNSNEPEFAVTTINDDDLLKLNAGSGCNEAYDHVNSNKLKNATEHVNYDKAELIAAANDRSARVDKHDESPIPNRDSVGTKCALVSNSDVSSDASPTSGDIHVDIESNYLRGTRAKIEAVIKTKLKESLRHKFKGATVAGNCATGSPKSEGKNTAPKYVDGNSYEQTGGRDHRSAETNKKQLQLERQREVNRAAQVRSREKKKNWISQMEREICLLKEEKKELWLENQSLKNEIVWLKTMLLYHKDCPVAKDPRITEEINRAVRTSQEELQKKTQKNPPPPPLPNKKMIPIRPNTPSVVTLTPISNSILVGVPSLSDAKKSAVQISTVASGSKTNVGPVIVPKLIPFSNASSVLGPLSTQPANFIIEVPLNVNVSTSEQSKVAKPRPCPKSKLERARERDGDRIIAFGAPGETPTPPKMFKNS